MGSLRSLRKSSVPQTRRGGKQQPVKHLATFPSLSLSPQSAEVNTDKVRWQKWEIIVTTVPHTIAPPKLIKAHRATAEAERIIHALFPFHFRSFFSLSLSLHFLSLVPIVPTFHLFPIHRSRLTAQKRCHRVYSCHRAWYTSLRPPQKGTRPIRFSAGCLILWCMKSPLGRSSNECFLVSCSRVRTFFADVSATGFLQVVWFSDVWNRP